MDNTDNLKPVACPRCALVLAYIRPKYNIQRNVPTGHILIMTNHTLVFDMNTILCPTCELHVRFSPKRNVATRVVAPDDNLLADLSKGS